MADFFELENRSLRRGFDTAAPTSGRWEVGETVWNSAPAASASAIGWKCTTAGSPGTWTPIYPQTFPNKDLSSVTSVTAAAAVAITANIVKITDGGFNVTIAAPAAANNGSTVNFVGAATVCTFVAGTGTEIVGNVTLTANTSATLKSAGTSWYRV